jgi:iron(III) transport system ATP-binding protein
VPIAIRQHDIAVLGRQPAETADNLMPARVERNVFLGAVRSYVMALGDGTQLKVAAPPHEDHAVGSAVWLRMPAERCRVLAD